MRASSSTTSPSPSAASAPPPGAAPGTRVTCEGFPGDAETNLRKMDKVFKAVAPDLKTDSQGVAGFKGVPMATPQGPCVAASLPGCEVRMLLRICRRPLRTDKTRCLH